MPTPLAAVLAGFALVAGMPTMPSRDAAAPPPPAPAYDLPVRWMSSAAGTSPAEGDPIVLSWSIVADGTPIDSFLGGVPACTVPGAAGCSSLAAALNSWFASPAVWLPVFHEAFGRWEEVCGVDFEFQNADDGSPLFTSPGVAPQGGSNGRADVRIGGRAYAPGFANRADTLPPPSGDILFNTSPPGGPGAYVSAGLPTSYFRNLVAHEIGHALGLDHVCPANGTKLMEATFAAAYPGAHPVGPQLDDIRGAHRAYGDRCEYGGGNETPMAATVLGTLSGTPLPLRYLSSDTLADTDCYRFTLAGCETATVRLVQEGEPVHIAGVPAGGSCLSVPFDSRLVTILRLELLDAAGASVATPATVNPITAEAMIIRNLPPGDWIIRVGGIGSLQPPGYQVQLYRLELSFMPLAPQPPPFIPPAGQPQPQSACLGGPATFTVSPAAAAGQWLAYQWRRNGVAIPGAQASSHVIPAVGPADIGTYDCIVRNFCTPVTSAAAALGLAGPQLAITQPQGPGSLRVANICGPASAYYFTAFSFDPMNTAAPPGCGGTALQPAGCGWWFGLHISFPDLAAEYQFAFPPFRGQLDGSGSSSFSVPPGSLVGLSGVTAWGVTLLIDPVTFVPTGATNVASALLQ